jgi:molecular chaperone HscB
MSVVSSKFAVLGVPERYDLAGDELEKRFRAESLRLHPDRFARAPAAERVAALSRATALNDAYRTLRSPLGRAEHLLELAGKALGEGEKVEQGFLLEILELREALAEARAAGDRAALAQLGADMTARRAAALDRLGVLFAEGRLDEAKIELIALRYYQRFLDEHAGKEAD